MWWLLRHFQKYVKCIFFQCGDNNNVHSYSSFNIITGYKASCKSIIRQNLQHKSIRWTIEVVNEEKERGEKIQRELPCPETWQLKQCCKWGSNQYWGCSGDMFALPCLHFTHLTISFNYRICFQRNYIARLKNKTAIIWLYFSSKRQWPTCIVVFLNACFPVVESQISSSKTVPWFCKGFCALPWGGGFAPQFRNLMFLEAFIWDSSLSWQSPSSHQYLSNVPAKEKLFCVQQLKLSVWAIGID